jgi:hypothetical protein
LLAVMGFVRLKVARPANFNQAIFQP